MLNHFWQILPDPALVNLYEFETEAVVLPAVRCHECGRTWATFARSAITSLDKLHPQIRRTPRPCDLTTWKALATALQELLPRFRASDLFIQVCARVEPELRRQRAASSTLSWTGSGECFVQTAAADILRAHTHSAVIYELCEPSMHSLVEVIPIQLDFCGFGEVLLCKACGYSDRNHIDTIGALKNYTVENPSRGIAAQIPGALVVDQTMKEAIEAANLKNVTFQLIAGQNSP